MIVFSGKCGQLGNRLFAFAHLIAIAEANEMKLINLSFDEYSPYFESTSKDIFCCYPLSRTLFYSRWIRSWLFLLNRAILKLLRLLKFHDSPFHGIVIADIPEYAFTEHRYFDLKDPVFLSKAKKKYILFLFGRFFRDYQSLETHQFIIRKYFTPIL